VSTLIEPYEMGVVFSLNRDSHVIIEVSKDSHTLVSYNELEYFGVMMVGERICLYLSREVSLVSLVDYD